jgi:hypothetical protein
VSKRLRWGLLVLFAILPLLVNVPAYSQSSEVGLYFPETGHWIIGDFLKIFRASKNSLEIYGLPITDQFVKGGKTIQYFEKARFVLEPDAPPALQVRLTPLGKILYKQGTPVQTPAGYHDCQKYPQTGFEICSAFLDFYKMNGGVAQFGYPISNFEIHGDLIVQYFQLARFEWHREAKNSQPVKVSNLGREFFDLMKEDPHLLLPHLTDSISQNVMGIFVQAFPGTPVVPLEGEQSLYVVVQDQNRQAVSGAKVSVTLIYPDGRVVPYTLTDTNASGVTSAEFDYSTTKPTPITLIIDVTFDNYQKTTRTSFRTWY